MYHYNIWYQSEIYFTIHMDFKPATWKELGALTFLKIVYDTMFFIMKKLQEYIMDIEFFTE